jgi:maleylpyruvate isomerase
MDFGRTALCRRLSTGIAKPMYESGAQRAQEIEGGAELEATALRNLLEAETSRLDDKWRRLWHAWSNPMRTPQGRTVPASDTLWMRTREVWIHAVDLDNGATFDAMPAIVATTLLSDIVDGWRENGAAVDIEQAAAGRTTVSIRENPTGEDFFASGSVLSLLQWMTGRGAVGLSPQDPPGPPR